MAAPPPSRVGGINSLQGRSGDEERIVRDREWRSGVGEPDPSGERRNHGDLSEVWYHGDRTMCRRKPPVRCVQYCAGHGKAAAEPCLQFGDARDGQPAVQ